MMKLVPPDQLSETDEEIRRILQEHPFAAQQLTFLLNGMRDLVRSYMNGADPADTVRSLAKDENAMMRMGIPLLETSGDWMKVHEQTKGEHSTPDLPPLSPYMCTVLYLFFDGEKPYDIYSNIAEGASHEEDQAFEAEVKALRAYFDQRSRQAWHQ